MLSIAMGMGMVCNLHSSRFLQKKDIISLGRRLLKNMRAPLFGRKRDRDSKIDFPEGVLNEKKKEPNIKPPRQDSLGEVIRIIRPLVNDLLAVSGGNTTVTNPLKVAINLKRVQEEANFIKNQLKLSNYQVVIRFFFRPDN
jgi:hypothetical protein